MPSITLKATFCFTCLLSLVLSDSNNSTTSLNGGLEISIRKISTMPIDGRTINFAEKEAIHLQDKKICNGTRICENGGSCIGHACLCLPATSGSFCEIIDDCTSGKLCFENEYTSCKYSIEEQKAYCRCRVIEYRFDDTTKTCRDCSCATSWNLNSFNNCEYQQGKRVCTCARGYSYNPLSTICERCDCGQYSTYCTFDDNGKTLCDCKEGYESWALGCKEHECGKNGISSYSYQDGMYKYCKCDPGYEEYNRNCVECSCGKYGHCLFDVKGKQSGCKCVKGYTEKLGKCEFCFCGDDSTCSFNGDKKVCNCKKGFENVNGFCSDINECEKYNPCNESKICINNLGSLECICRAGYKRKLLSSDCEDIDECLDTSMCKQPNTKCKNTEGSFTCICESGYITLGGTNSNTFCERTPSGLIYGIVLAFTGVALYVSMIFYGFARYPQPEIQARLLVLISFIMTSVFFGRRSRVPLHMPDSS